MENLNISNINQKIIDKVLEQLKKCDNENKISSNSLNILE